MYVDTDILFPNSAIPALRRLRSEKWRQLVDEINSLPDDNPKVLGFVLMMIRINGCLECETDSYRAMRGCAACAVQTLHRYRGTDQELLDLYAQACRDIEVYLAEQADEVRRIA